MQFLGNSFATLVTKKAKKEFCEACAVKCHKNHDVHFVEFSNFECQCGYCQCMPNGEQNESIWLWLDKKIDFIYNNFSLLT